MKTLSTHGPSTEWPVIVLHEGDRGAPFLAYSSNQFCWWSSLDLEGERRNVSADDQYASVRELLEAEEENVALTARLRAAEELIEAIDAERAVEGDCFDPGTVEEQRAATLIEIRAKGRVLEKRAAWDKVK